MSAAPEVVVVSGHMVDAPDRAQPRFPQSEVDRVTHQVRDVLDDWNVGPATTLVTSGARGADIIAAEEAHARGAKLRLVLAHEPDEFEQQSVAIPETDWAARFRALLDRAQVEVVGGEDEDVYARTNERIIDVARRLTPHPRALIVWNGEAGDGAGGTSDFVARLERLAGDDRITVIDPTPPPAS